MSEDYCSNVKDTVSLNILPDAKPTFLRARTVPVRLQDMVKNELQRLEQAGTITKVHSSDWASPTVNVLKSNNSVRICGDFSSTVNKYLNPVHSPLPTVDDVIARVGAARIFSKLDLTSAFNQLPLNEESKQYTTINTSECLFVYNYLPFGLSASPGLFQSYMSKLLHNIDNVIAYQDDLLIMSPTISAHNDTLEKVLTVLKNAGVKINAQKSTFFTNEVHYLGYVFSSNGVYPSKDKIRAITDCPPPADLKQLQAFIGLANFYRRFIPNFSDLLSPLYKLLKKGTKFHWSHEQQNSFDAVKEILIKDVTLKYFNPNIETLLETDSSGYGVAAVLMQRENDKHEWQPVQFASRTLNNAERNYSNIEREALSVVFGVSKFKHFLLGGKFVIKNDHMPLEKLLGKLSPVPTTCSARLQRWALKLSHFDYVLEYSKGKFNVNSDWLSRLPLPDTNHVCEPYELVFTVNSLRDLSISCETIKQHTENDQHMSQLYKHVKYGWPIKNDSPLRQYKNVIGQMSILKGCLLFNNRVVIPQSLRSNVLKLFHDGHPGMSSMKSFARSLIWYPGMDRDIVNLVSSCEICQSVRTKPSKCNLEWPMPTKPWSRIHVDHFFYERNICLLAIDALSKYIECEIVCTTNVTDTINAVKSIFARNGLCDVLVSDNASCFTSEHFRNFLSLNGIKHITPPPASPASNGQGERGVRVIKDMLKKCNSCDSFKSKLNKVLLQYRSSPHSTTQIPPSVSLNNRKYVTVKDRVNPNYCHFDQTAKLERIKQFDVGDQVLALNLREGKKWMKATIVEKLGINVYNVIIHDYNVLWKRHYNQLLPLKEQDISVSDSNNPVVVLSPEQESVFPQNHDIPNKDVYVGPTLIDNQNISVRPIVHNNKSSAVELRKSSRPRKPTVRYGFDD